MVATTALGMGMNVPDVTRVCQQKLPIGDTFQDTAPEVWQRLGRGGRGFGRSSVGYIFLPYWYFDHLGMDKSGQKLPEPKTKKKVVAKKQYKHMLPSQRTYTRSQLQQLFTPGDISDTFSVASHVSNASNASSVDQQAPTRPRKGEVPFWTIEEAVKRRGRCSFWDAVCNKGCRRIPFLELLGEFKLPGAREGLAKTGCCDICDPLFCTPLSVAPEAPKAVTFRKGSRSHIALEHIDEWARSGAKKNTWAKYPFPNARLCVYKFILSKAASIPVLA
ncbi:hypothetical protein ONS96_010580 [Cadophora gregata f. sp. sojae]|nr:hypothetical protein ONS96_010580 [Cadophora gregata f. sp. sojae]